MVKWGMVINFGQGRQGDFQTLLQYFHKKNVLLLFFQFLAARVKTDNFENLDIPLGS